MFCWIGLHKWRTILRKLVYWDQRNDVYQITVQCDRCKKQMQYYDTRE